MSNITNIYHPLRIMSFQILFNQIFFVMRLYIILYNILSIPAYILFLLYKKRKNLIEEDYIAWIRRHNLSSAPQKKAFTELMRRFPEYRDVFYYRLPFAIRHALRMILHRRGCELTCGRLGGGCPKT